MVATMLGRFSDKLK